MIRVWVGSKLVLLGAIVVITGLISAGYSVAATAPAIWPERSAPVGTYDMGIYGWYLSPNTTYEVVVIDPNGFESSSNVVTDASGAISTPHVVQVSSALGLYNVSLRDLVGVEIATTTFWHNNIGM